MRNFLQTQALIIVYYSGWENDVIMMCLKKRLNYPTPLTYIWVCYSHEDYNLLMYELEQASRSKDFESAIYIIGRLSEIVLSDADTKFVCESLIVEFIKNDEIIKSFDLKIALHNSALDFIEKNCLQLIFINVIEDALDKGLYMRVKTFERGEYVKIINQIYDISSKYDFLLSVHLASIERSLLLLMIMMRN